MALYRILAGALLMLAASAIAEEPLELESQFGDTVGILQDGKARIIVYADRDGSDQADAWGEALESIPCPAVAAANLSAVPDLARSMVRDSFREREPIALDWRGEIAERLGFTEGEANVYLVDGEFSLQAHIAGAPSASAIARLETVAGRTCQRSG